MRRDCHHALVAMHLLRLWMRYRTPNISKVGHLCAPPPWHDEDLVLLVADQTAHTQHDSTPKMRPLYTRPLALAEHGVVARKAIHLLEAEGLRRVSGT